MLRQSLIAMTMAAGLATGAVAEPAMIDLTKNAVRTRIDIPANGAVRVS